MIWVLLSHWLFHLQVRNGCVYCRPPHGGHMGNHARTYGASRGSSGFQPPAPGGHP
jgi:hypothetical protein